MILPHIRIVFTSGKGGNEKDAYVGLSFILNVICLIDKKDLMQKLQNTNVSNL